MILRVAFDFDGTLEEPVVQAYAVELLKQNIEVCIVTSRPSSVERRGNGTYSAVPVPVHKALENHPDIKQIANNLGIYHIYFTDWNWKYKFFHKNQYFILHIDDDPDETMIAKTNGCKIPFVFWDEPGWEQKCNDLIKQAKDALEGQVLL